VDVNPNTNASARAAHLNTRLLQYSTLYNKRMRRRYLGVAAVGAALVWFVLALLYFVDKQVPNAFLWGLAATILLPSLALFLVHLRKPTQAQTARVLDTLLDDRQRVVTSTELLTGSSAAPDLSSPIVDAQLATTARMLDSVEPHVLYPAKMPVGPMLVASALVILAIGVWLLRGAGDDPALAAGGLPPTTDTTQAVATATALSGLPDSAQNPPQQDAQPGAAGTAQAGDDGGTGTSGDQTQPGGSDSGGASGNSSQLSPQQAQQQADSSRGAEKSLQRLAQALDGQGVTQGTADDIRKGDYAAAGDALADLGANNDQLSQDAQDSLAQNLDDAADDSSGSPGLQSAERNAATALRGGDYNRIKQALEDLGQAVKDAGKDVVPQQDLAKNFPTQQPNAGSGNQGQQGQQGQQPQGDQSQQGDRSQQGQTPAQGQQGDQSQQGQGQQGSGGQPDPGTNGSSPENGRSGTNSGGTSTEGGQNGTNPGGQGADSGSDPSLPGEGSKVEGPLGQGLDAAGNPFEIAGNDNPDPNGTRPGDPQQPGALTLDTNPGSAGSTTGPSSGGPVDAPGESAAPPVGRWGIIQRYFSQDQK
jgi:hypothetical protein